MSNNSYNTFPAISKGKIGEDQIQTVNARDLHSFLEIGKVFGAWINDRIDQYGFTENLDFVCFPVLESKGRGGHNRKEYHISIDMAKELSMVERNEKGKQARQYFIECERQAKNPQIALNDPATLKVLLLENVEKVIALESKVSEMQEDVEVLERISKADGSLCVTEAAKALQMRPKDLFAWLSANGWIYKRTGSSYYLGYQSKTQIGLLEHKITTVYRADGTEKVTEQVRITAKGMTRLANLIKPALSAA